MRGTDKRISAPGHLTILFLAAFLVGFFVWSEANDAGVTDEEVRVILMVRLDRRRMAFLLLLVGVVGARLAQQGSTTE